ncbi:MAG TPA: hypothetical protein VN948_05290 [Terriglobales bacterium]|nr:hypothetical protein [Terriglobales bacterium]
MTWRGIQVLVTWIVVAITFLYTIGAGAASIDQLNTNPAVVQSASNLFGLPIAVAVGPAGIYDMTHRGWIYSFSPTPGFPVVVSVKMLGANTANNGVDFPAIALAVNGNDVYAGRNNGTILHYNSSLSLQQNITLTAKSLAGLTVDSSGHVYAATPAGTIVQMNSSLGTVTTGSVTPAAGQTVVAIKVDPNGNNLYVAISDGTFYQLNSSLVTQKTGSVPGTAPMTIACNSVGNVAVATSSGLFMFSATSPNLMYLNHWNQTGLLGVDIDDGGDVVAGDSAGNVYVMGTSLSVQRSTSAGFQPAQSIAIYSGSIYVVGGPDVKSEGDPHLTTIDGVRYDFQSAGEFVLFRHKGDLEGPACGEKIDASESRHDDHDGHDSHEAVEIQVRQYPVATTANTCVSLNAAVAARVGKHKMTYEPNLSGQPDPSGLQLRIDGKLMTLDPNGVGFGEGGRIVPTSASGGLEVDLPDDTMLFVTPGWWASQSKWYLNVNVEPERRACGLAGNVPNGSWLPALPDGTSMGPKPTSAHQQYVDLYERFADAWRVTDKSSLFDYAPGTSTATFTMPGWPPESGACTIPGAVPAEGATEEVAREACKGVPGDPANCIFDVRVTGLTNIANTYVASRNVQPVQKTTQPECHCEREAGGGTVALLTFLGLLALWILSIQARRRRTT